MRMNGKKLQFKEAAMFQVIVYIPRARFCCCYCNDLNIPSQSLSADNNCKQSYIFCAIIILIRIQ